MILSKKYKWIKKNLVSYNSIFYNNSKNYKIRDI